MLNFPPLFKVKEPEPELYIPSYVFSPQIPPMQPSQHTSMPKKSQTEEALKTNKDGLETSKQNQPTLSDYLANQYRMMRVSKKTNPVHLVGEKLFDDPLRELLGIALTARLVYPKIAVELHMKGVVSIELLLHPDGNVTNVRLVKSSKEQVLDVSALNAVHDMSPVQNVDLYIKSPKQLVINVIFN